MENYCSVQLSMKEIVFLIKSQDLMSMINQFYILVSFEALNV